MSNSLVLLSVGVWLSVYQSVHPSDRVIQVETLAKAQPDTDKCF